MTLRTSDQFGGEYKGGSLFEIQSPNNCHIVGLVLSKFDSSGFLFRKQFISSIQVIFSDGSRSKTLGKLNSATWTFNPRSGEVITRISVRCGGYIDAVRITSNMKEYDWFGGDGGNLKEFNLFGKLVTVIGKIGDYVDMLQFVESVSEPKTENIAPVKEMDIIPTQSIPETVEFSLIVKDDDILGNEDLELTEQVVSIDLEPKTQPNINPVSKMSMSLRASDQFGGEYKGGNLFEVQAPAGQHIVGFVLSKYDNGMMLFRKQYISSIQMIYSDGTYSKTFGKLNSDTWTLKPRPGEFVTKIGVRCGGYIDALKFMTNLEAYEWFGGGGGTFKEFGLYSCGNLVCVRGKAGDYLDSIQFIENAPKEDDDESNESNPGPDIDIVFVGAGPIGLWTSVQTKLQCPSAKIILIEKYKEYQRKHVAYIDPASFNTSNKDPEFQELIKPLTGFVPTKKTEGILKDFALKLGIQIEYETVTSCQELAEKYKKAKVIVGSDGTHSVVVNQIFNDSKKSKHNLQCICEVKYFVKGETRALNQWTEASICLLYSKHLITEYVGRMMDDITPVTLRLFISRDEFKTLEKATFKNPYLWIDEHIKIMDPNVVASIEYWLNYRKNLLKDEAIEIKVTSLTLDVSINEKIIKTAYNKTFVLVGDSAFGVPYFRSLNNGLVCGNRLAIALAQSIESNYDRGLLDYQDYVKQLENFESNQAHLKNSSLDLVRSNLTYVQAAKSSFGEKFTSSKDQLYGTVKLTYNSMNNTFGENVNSALDFITTDMFNGKPVSSLANTANTITVKSFNTTATIVESTVGTSVGIIGNNLELTRGLVVGGVNNTMDNVSHGVGVVKSAIGGWFGL